jgi:hypothetical protein
MNAYEQCQPLRRGLLSRAAEVMNYTSWSDDIAASQLREVHEKLKDKIGAINIAELTAERQDQATWPINPRRRIL